MSVTETQIDLPGGAGSERVLKDDSTQRMMEVVAHVDSGGNLIDPATKGPLDGFELSDWTDETVNPQYEGFLRADGAWAIKKMDAGASPRYVRWAAGLSAYTTNWANRDTSLSYDYFNVVF